MFLIKHSLNHQYSLWFFRIVWLREQLTLDHLRHWALVSAMVLGSVIGLQLAYPRSFSLPRTHIAGEYAGLSSKSAITSKLQPLTTKEITVDTTYGKQVVKPEALGAAINPEATAEKAATYSTRERFIPFSWVFKKTNLSGYELKVDEGKLKTFSQELTKQNKAPVDAAIKVQGANSTVTGSIEGYSYDVEQVKNQVQNSTVGKDLTLYIKPKTLSPAISTESAEQINAQIKQRISTPLDIEGAGGKVSIDAQTMASWVVISPDPANKTINVSFDRTKIRAKLLSLSSRLYIAETPTRITLVDGEPVNTDPGLAGQALVLDASIDEVIASANTGKTAAKVKLQAVAPNTEIIRTYTKTSKGLQALINHWVQTHGGSYGISLRDLSGNIVAGYNADKQFTSASIYKIYVAYVVYDRIASGTMTMDDGTGTGSNIADCLDKMIVWSDNGCAVALGNMIGWHANDAKLRSRGFGSTHLESGNHLTTANDSSTFLVSLAKGELMRADLNKALIELMSRQKFRMGIPAGSKGSSVANKIGDAGTYKHDVAIVYSPNGPYVLSILTAGTGFGNIYNLANQISNAMNQ